LLILYYKVYFHIFIVILTAVNHYIAYIVFGVIYTIHLILKLKRSIDRRYNKFAIDSRL